MHGGTYLDTYEWKFVSLRSLRTPASNTSNSSELQPRPPSPLGRGHRGHRQRDGRHPDGAGDSPDAALQKDAQRVLDGLRPSSSSRVRRPRRSGPPPRRPGAQRVRFDEHVRCGDCGRGRRPPPPQSPAPCPSSASSPPPLQPRPRPLPLRQPSPRRPSTKGTRRSRKCSARCFPGRGPPELESPEPGEGEAGGSPGLPWLRWKPVKRMQKNRRVGVAVRTRWKNPAQGRSLCALRRRRSCQDGSGH